jgi:hypothetical protein
MPQKLMHGLEWMGGMMHLPLNPELLRKPTENYVVNNAKIKRALGVEHIPVTANEGLRRTVQSFLK